MTYHTASQSWVNGKPIFFENGKRVSLQRGRELFETGIFGEAEHLKEWFDSETKGGRLARSAAMLCQSADFRLWLDRRRRAKFNMDIPDGTHTEGDAREFICEACGIKSRAELDHNPDAAALFRKVQQAFGRYQNHHRRQQDAN
jgi:hypothetical protein